MARRILSGFFLLALTGVLAACSLPLAGADAPAAGAVPGIRALARERVTPSPGPVVAVLAYHDVSDRPDAPPHTVSPAALRATIRRCREAGWIFLSLSELLAYRDRPEALPPRALVLTFDDALRSFHDTVLPILREEGAKAALAVVTSFLDDPPPDLPPLMTWDQVREADRSGIVEIVSHSHALHRYETSNPYRDTGPSVAVRRYLLEEERYEDREEYRERIREDLETSRRVLRETLGRDVAVLAWPYGEHTAMARALAAEAGFAATLGLDGTGVRPEDLRSGYLPRVMVFRDMRIEGKDPGWLYPSRRPVRAAQVDLDGVYDPDPGVFREKVDRLVAKVKGIGATHVFLQACPDPGGDGFFRETWFMNHQVPVRADVWSMVAHTFAHAGLAVWIRAPAMNLSWEWARHPGWRIPFRKKRGGREPAPWYFRLSPDLPDARRGAIDFFTDIAVYLPIQGILFDDDAYMLAEERLRGGGSSPEAKATAIRGHIEAIKAAVLAWRPGCAFGRNIYAPAVEHDGVHPKFSQDFGQFLRDYDLTVVMAYARMEGHGEDAARWVESLARRAAAKWAPPKGRESEAPPVMLKFQAYDWAEEAWVPGEELAALVRGARAAMAADLGVYPVLPDEGAIPPGLLGGPVPAPQNGMTNRTSPP